MLPYGESELWVSQAVQVPYTLDVDLSTLRRVDGLIANESERNPGNATASCLDDGEGGWGSLLQ